jgi:hypothetical protein
MPYSKKAKYTHHRQKSPKQFQKSPRMKTVPLDHTNYRGKKLDKKGAKAIVGVLKPQFRTAAKRGGKKRRWGIQSILVPK